MLKEKQLVRLHNRAFSNKQSIASIDEEVGCFYCVSIFPATKIKEYTRPRGSDMGTAICPNCGIDSIINEENINLDILEQMHERWFK